MALPITIIHDINTGKYWFNNTDTFLGLTSNSYELYPDLAQYLINQGAGYKQRSSKGVNFIPVTTSQQFRDIYRRYIDTKPGNYEAPKGYKELYNLPEVPNTGLIVSGQPQQGTEFQQYFKAERAKGRSADDILKDNPFINKSVQTPQTVQISSIQQTQKRKPTEEEIQTEIKNYPGLSRDAAIGNVQMRINKEEKTPIVKTEQPKTVLTQTTPVDIQQQLFDDTAIPTEIKNDPAYKNATPEQKQLLALTYNTTQARTSEESRLAQEALQEAIKLTDPYFREQIRMAQDQLTRALTGVEKDRASTVTQLDERMKQIREDLAFNRGELSLEQQSELAQQLREYQTQREEMSQGFAEAGLAFSSPREVAEQRLKQTQEGIAESTARKYNRSLRELQTGSERQLQAAAAQLADVNRQTQERKTDIYRQAESTLGTQNLPQTGDLQPLGGITGQQAEERQRAILGLEQTLLTSKLPPSTLNLLKF